MSDFPVDDILIPIKKICDELADLYRELGRRGDAYDAEWVAKSIEELVMQFEKGCWDELRESRRDELDEIEDERDDLENRCGELETQLAVANERLLKVGLLEVQSQ